MQQGPNHFSAFLHHFVFVKLATSSIRVKSKHVVLVPTYVGDVGCFRNCLHIFLDEYTQFIDNREISDLSKCG